MKQNLSYLLITLSRKQTIQFFHTSLDSLTKDVTLSINQVNLYLQAVCEWAVKDKLELNAEKTKEFIIGAKDLSLIPAVKMCGSKIIYSNFEVN